MPSINQSTNNQSTFIFPESPMYLLIYKPIDRNGIEKNGEKEKRETIDSDRDVVSPLSKGWGDYHFRNVVCVSFVRMVGVSMKKKTV
jgi:hypothetical protein